MPDLSKISQTDLEAELKRREDEKKRLEQERRQKFAAIVKELAV